MFSKDTKKSLMKILEIERRINEEKSVFLDTEPEMFRTPQDFVGLASNHSIPEEYVLGANDANDANNIVVIYEGEVPIIEDQAASTSTQNPKPSAIPTTTNILPSYEELKTRDMEEKVKKLEK